MAQMRARDAAIADIYANPSTSLVQTYGITLLYVGLYEREGVGRTCPTAGPYPTVMSETFPGPEWALVFASGDVRIYQRTGTR
jgi:hypothetical protein